MIKQVSSVRFQEMHFSRDTLTTSLRITSQLLWVVGLLLSLSGLYLLFYFSKSHPFFSGYSILMPGVLALSTAALLLFAGVIGCMAAAQTSVFLQGLSSVSPQFVYLLVVAVCLQGTASALAYYYSDKVDSELSVLSEVFYNYSGSSQDPLARAVDSTQEELQCCGVQGSRDWLSTPWFNRSRRATFPQSCCNSSCFHCTSSSEEHWEPYVQGCQERLEEALGFVLSLITWSLLPLLPVEVRGHALQGLVVQVHPFCLKGSHDRVHPRDRGGTLAVLFVI
ncbi:tetraspanin 37 isoform X1 [Gadus morhua]|uniref:tetraspanin 37 isoform X1 n=1 Tax=Gadus morhua TaxID=8049 RepID=UPI0011B477FB|nr:tetraspanin-3-like isoform X1 [Gadus morhua]